MANLLSRLTSILGLDNHSKLDARNEEIYRQAVEEHATKQIMGQFVGNTSDTIPFSSANPKRSDISDYTNNKQYLYPTTQLQDRKDALFYRRLYQPALINTLRNLVIHNPQVSKAFSNNVLLGSTKYKFFVNEEVDKATYKKMNAHIIKAIRKSYPGGISSLINGLLAQLSIHGAVSVEFLVKSNLRSIDKIKLLNPEDTHIGETANGDTVYLQEKRYSILDKDLKTVYRNLNPNTYMYRSMFELDGNPYGIPPFIASIGMVKVKDNLYKGINNLVCNLGVYGFLSTLVTKPARASDSETDEQYLDRCKLFLQEVSISLREGLSNGLVVGYKGVHEFEIKDSVGNSDAADTIWSSISMELATALKQDPLMFGMSVNTTETLGRVILALASSQLETFQNIICDVMSNIIETECRLAGFSFEEITFEMEMPTVSDKLRSTQEYGLRIDNAIKLYMQGVIDNHTLAWELGYTDAKRNEPIPAVGITPPKKVKPKGEKVNAINPQRDTTVNKKTEYTNKLSDLISEVEALEVANKGTLDDFFNYIQE